MYEVKIIKFQKNIMKKIILFPLFIVFIFFISVYGSDDPTYIKFNPNNISTYIISSGIFNQDIRTNNTPGLEWKAGSKRFLVFSSGLIIGARINGKFKMASCSYWGEYIPGCVQNGIPYTNSNFKIYKISKGDGPSNPDWLNWYKMVPYGAPYVDVNGNGIFELGLDTPGVKNAKQTIFMCITDGFQASHSQSEGFSGGTTPLFSEIHFTAWGYNTDGLNDVQFFKYDIINKGSNPWNSVFMGLFADPDIGDATDDYVGCDTTIQLGYAYNADNYDGTGNPPSYGQTPPAFGFILLKGFLNKSVIPNVDLKMTSFHPLFCSGCGAPNCEVNPYDTLSAYNSLKGLKNDGSHFMNPLVNPPIPTKFCYTGNPETGTGWSEYRGSVLNCGGDTGTIILSNPPMDQRFLISSGADNFNINPGDTQRIIFAQLAARGLNNKNTVTQLQHLAYGIWDFYDDDPTFGMEYNYEKIIIPKEIELYQNYPNPFNATTNIRFDIAEEKFVSLKVYDILGQEVAVLVNQVLRPNKYVVNFDASNLPSGIYVYYFKSGVYFDAKRMMVLK